MIPQLKKRLDRYIKQSEKNDKKYQNGEKTFENYFVDRFEIDRRINAIFELEKKRIKEKEFSDAQLDLMFDEAS